MASYARVAAFDAISSGKRQHDLGRSCVSEDTPKARGYPGCEAYIRESFSPPEGPVSGSVFIPDGRALQRLGGGLRGMHDEESSVSSLQCKIKSKQGNLNQCGTKAVYDVTTPILSRTMA